MQHSFPQFLKGLTLLEVLATVVILVLLFAIVSGLTDYTAERERRVRTELSLVTLEQAIEHYHRRLDQYPVVVSGESGQRSAELLRLLRQELCARSFWEHELLIESETLVDGWGNPLFYAHDPAWEHGLYVLFSTGRSGQALLPNALGQYESEHPLNLDNLSP